ALSEQAAQVCRDTRTPLALLTNGQHWVLIHARPGEPTGAATFDADLWLEEQSLLRAFATLLAAPRVLAPPTAPDGTPSTSLAAHGGSLFDPARFPWLTKSAITDRVVHEMLDALLILRHRGKAAERLSYKSLDVEQIGHVYEGLLEFSCMRVDTPYLGLIGKN